MVVRDICGHACREKLDYWLTQKSSFYINLPFGAVAVLAVFLFFHTPAAAKPQSASLREKFLQMDLFGVALICAAVFCYLLALQWGGVTKTWSSRDVVGTLVGFGILSLAFIINEWYQGERALLLTSILKDWTIASGCIISFL